MTETKLNPSSYEISHPDISRIEVHPTRELTAIAAAKQIIQTVQNNPNATIVYATGETMVPVYQYVAQAVAEGIVDFSNTTAFHLNERWPISPEEPESFTGYIQEKVIVPFGILKENAHLINGKASDPFKEAIRYNNLLRNRDIDLAVIGFGPPPGVPIAFNEAGASLDAETHATELAQETLDRDRIERSENVPNWAITLGHANIASADKVIGIAYGENKGIGLRSALYEDITEDVSASALRTYGHKVKLFIDHEAAKQLQFAPAA